MGSLLPRINKRERGGISGIVTRLHQERATPRIFPQIPKNVQKFGRELITRLFEAGHGEEYVNKLSEHPAEPMQLFALKLLEREAQHSERSARVAADILTRISATAAITDRASAVEILLGIKTAWPTIETPISVRAVEVRGVR